MAETTTEKPRPEEIPQEATPSTIAVDIGIDNRTGHAFVMLRDGAHPLQAHLLDWHQARRIGSLLTGASEVVRQCGVEKKMLESRGATVATVAKAAMDRAMMHQRRSQGDSPRTTYHVDLAKVEEKTHDQDA